MNLDVFYDYHCPYCHRAIAWLDDLGDRVAPRYRLFALEQVNRDPTATAWRLWEQPLDYENDRGRQDRRPLAAFLATALLEAPEAREPAEVVRAFRRAVFSARFGDGLDISEPVVLVTLARNVGADGDRLATAFADAGALAPARERIREDWHAARSDHAIFGVPTLRLEGRAPFYLRLARPVDRAEGLDLLERLRGLDAAAPYVLELKRPDPIVAT